MTKIETFEIWIGDDRLIEATVEITANYYDETTYTAPSCDYSWKCLELTETFEDGTIVHLEVDDYEDQIEQMVIAEI